MFCNRRLFFQCMRQNYFTCRLGKCGGCASFTRWIFKFISRIGVVVVVVVVVVIFVIDLGGLDVRIHAKKNVKVFFGLEFLGSFLRGIISILKMQTNAFWPERWKQKWKSDLEALCLDQTLFASYVQVEVWGQNKWTRKIAKQRSKDTGRCFMSLFIVTQ